MNDQGEASGLVTAQRILDQYKTLSNNEKFEFHTAIFEEFAIDEDTLQKSISDWVPGDANSARKIHFAAEPKSQELIRKINRVPGATADLVAMWADLLKSARQSKSFAGLDEDFKHLFSSWFNRGFLEMRLINWSTPAEVLEKIIAYEAVHEINGWDDLRQRVGDPDRRLFAFFHPSMPAEPLIFVQVALTDSIPTSIKSILRPDHEQIDPHEAKTAVFYLISDCQKGLRGISFGKFLIRQVVVELQRQLPGLETFVTLSSIPMLRKWAEDAAQDEDSLMTEEESKIVSDLLNDTRPSTEFAKVLAARYLTKMKRSSGHAFDPVAHFHLGNGASLHAIHPEADLSDQGLQNSWGVLANYLYDGRRIE